MRKLIGIVSVIVLAGLSATELPAHWRRHPHRHGRAWARSRIVVGRPVVVAPVVIQGRPHGTIDFNVDPSDTKVYVDGEMRGQVDDFDGNPGKLHLLPGARRIRLEAPDGSEWSERVRVVAGHEINIKLELED